MRRTSGCSARLLGSPPVWVRGVAGFELLRLQHQLKFGSGLNLKPVLIFVSSGGERRGYGGGGDSYGRGDRRGGG